MPHKAILFFSHNRLLMLCALLFLSASCSSEIQAENQNADLVGIPAPDTASIEAAQNDDLVDIPVPDTTSIEAALQAKLERLSAWSYREEPDYNIDSLGTVLGHEMAAYLSEKPFPMDEHTVNLERIASADSLLMIYSYKYSSGGTAGAINTTIIQWKKPGGKFGAKILELPAYFYESHILSQTKQHTLYLLLGGWKGSSRLQVAVALVIELAGDSLNLAYPAFYRKYPYLEYYDDVYSSESYGLAAIDYLPGQKKLVIENLGSEDKVGVQAHDESSLRDYLKGRKKITYTFDGKQFIED